LARLRPGPAEFPRHGRLYFRAANPPAPNPRPLLEATQPGAKVTVSAEIQRTNGRAALVYSATITNTGDHELGVRKRFVYPNLEHEAYGSDKTRSDFVPGTDTTAPVSCLQPGQSITQAREVLESIRAGDRLHAAIFVTLGDCRKPDRRLRVGGFWLDWTKAPE